MRVDMHGSGSHGLSARRVPKAKSKGLKGLQLEVSSFLHLPGFFLAISISFDQRAENLLPVGQIEIDQRAKCFLPVGLEKLQIQI